MSRLVVLLLAVAVLGVVVPVVAPGAAQAAPTSPCATYAETRQVEKGMTRRQVETLLGIRTSRMVDGGAGGYTRGYASCNGTHEAVVEYAVRREGATPRATGFTRWIRTATST